MNIDITLIKENPINHEIYSDEDPDQFIELFEKIKASGYIKPLVINRNYLILSGHRRYKCALELGRKIMDVEVYKGDDDKELEMLLNENAFRDKTTLQKVREAEFYRKIEEKKAEERRNFMGLQNLGYSSEVDLNPPLEEKGKVRDIVGAKIGLSGKVYDKARKVVNRIDNETEEVIKFLFEETLNENIEAASKLIDKPDEFLQLVIERTDGDVKKVSSIVRELEHEEKINETQLPPGKYQVIYADLTNQNIEEDFYQLPISELGEDNSVLFLWVTPEGLTRGLKLAQNAGFQYRTALVHNNDFLNEPSNNAEILLISVKGNPAMICQGYEPYRNGNKPRVIRERILETYSGDKIELLADGWEIWGKEV